MCSPSAIRPRLSKLSSDLQASKNFKIYSRASSSPVDEQRRKYPRLEIFFASCRMAAAARTATPALSSHGCSRWPGDERDGGTTCTRSVSAKQGFRSFPDSVRLLAKDLHTCTYQYVRLVYLNRLLRCLLSPSTNIQPCCPIPPCSQRESDRQASDTSGTR